MPDLYTDEQGRPLAPPALYTDEQGLPMRPPSSGAGASWGEQPGRLQQFAHDVLTGFDPTTGQGLRHLAEAGGAMGLTALTGGGDLAVGAAAAIPPMVGAAAGGMGMKTLQNLYETFRGQRPVSELTTGVPETGEGAALAEGLGQMISWPFKGVGRRLIASRVWKNATEALEGMRENVTSQLKAGLDAVTQTLDKYQAEWMSQFADRPEASALGRQVETAVQGPASNTLKQLGQAVKATAQTGPDLNIAPVKAKLESMAAEGRPSFVAQEGASDAAKWAANLGSRGAATSAETATYLQRLADAGVTLEPSHPLPGVLADIQQAPDTVSFADAHILKRKLYDAVNFESPAKGPVKQITKGISGTLRGAMRGHAPYDEANAAYEAAAPLFSEGYAAKLHDAVLTLNPEEIAAMVKGTEPTKLGALKDLLLNYVPKGGGGTTGQDAFNALRARWGYDNLVHGQFGKLEELLADPKKMDPEFLRTMFGDQEGSLYLNNLRRINAAVTEQQATGEATKASLQALTPPTRTELALMKSSVGRAPSPTEVTTNVARGLLPASLRYKVAPLMRAIQGPELDELVQWAAYSPARTQRLVSLFTGPAMGMAFADIFRDANIPLPAALRRSLPWGYGEAPAGLVENIQQSLQGPPSRTSPQLVTPSGLVPPRPGPPTRAQVETQQQFAR